MPCKQIELKDEWNKDLSCYQKLPKCKHSGNTCSGTDEICSRYEESEVKKPETKKDEKPAEKPEAKEEDGEAER